MSTWRFAVWLLPVTVFAGMSLAGVLPEGRTAPQHYDPAKEITIQATVRNIATGTGRMHAVVWTVTTEDRSLTVFLGPASFVKEKMESNKLSVAVGDQVVVTGAPLPNRTDVIVAREVKYKDTALTLRDQHGRPVWARGPGWRR